MAENHRVVVAAGSEGWVNIVVEDFGDDLFSLSFSEVGGGKWVSK
jgi:hypothetical protein